MYNATVINASLAHTELVANITVTTAAECQSLVRDRYPEANAAEYSNEGHAWCKAVFNACVCLPVPSVCVSMCTSLSVHLCLPDRNGRFISISHATTCLSVGATLSQDWRNL